VCSAINYYLETADGLKPSRRKLERSEGQNQAAVGPIDRQRSGQINGRRDQLEGKIQQRYGLAKDRVRKDADDLVGRSVLVMVTG